MAAVNLTSPWVPTDPVGSGDNAWQLTAATLVGMQSIPGLMVMYAGIMKRKWAINSAFMVFYAFSAVLICWVLWGYKASFGEPTVLPFLGYPGNVLGMGEMLTQSYLPSVGLAQNFPLATMVYFQFVFAAITLILIAGAFLGRMNFYAWMLFVPLWLTICYIPGAYSIWGGGFLFKLGVIDYSGGYVIHMSAGTAGFIGCYFIGPRHDDDREDQRPNNILTVLVGAGILWIGWNGFNGGDPYAASADAGVAVLNTNLCTAVSLLSWMACDVAYYKKPSIIGAVNGMITGLVAITPAAGVVAGWGAILLGLGSGIVPWVSYNFWGKTKMFQRHFDDTLGITHTHLVASFVGGFGTGLWATVDGCAAFGLTNPGGAVAGNGIQLGYQMAGACFIMGWNAFFVPIIMLFIKYVCRVPLRMSEEALLAGDHHTHGENAYTFGSCDTHEVDPENRYIQGTAIPPGRLTDEAQAEHEKGASNGEHGERGESSTS